MPGLPPPRSLSALIAPMSPATFFSRHFETGPLHVRGDARRFEGLLTLDDVDRTVTTLDQRLGDVVLARPGEAIGLDSFADEAGCVDVSKLLALHAGGATIVLNHLDELHPPLGELCAALALELSAPVQANVYVTPPSGLGFEAHVDGHDVMVLQVSGSKRWRFAPGAVELPLQVQAEAQAGCAVSEGATTVRLEPGDMLYLPRGYAHAAAADDETSVHVTLGLIAYTWADLLHEALANGALEEAELRSAITPGFLRPGADPGPLAERFRALLAKLGERSDFTQALDALRTDFLARHRASQRGRLADIAAPPALELQSRLVIRPQLAYALREDSEAIVIRQGDREIRVPALGAEAVRFALRGAPFQVEALPGRLDPASKLVLARRLVREGLLVFANEV